MKYKLLAILIVCNLAGAVTNNIIPKLSHKHTTIGEKFNYSFVLPDFPYRPSFNLSFKDLSKNEDILIVTQSIKIRRSAFYYQAEIIPFKTGRIDFPSFNILNNRIQSVRITINSVLAPKTTPNFLENYQPYNDYSDLVLIFFIILIVTSLYFGLKHYKNFIEEQKKILTPEQKHKLWAELISLFSEGYPQNIKPYYFQTSEQLKYFVERILDLRIRELTTNEIKKYLETSDLREKSALLVCLELADPVKFAKFIPEQADYQEYQIQARKFLQAHEPAQEDNTGV